MTQSSCEFFYCLLDNVRLADARIEFDGLVLRRFETEELLKLFRTHDEPPVSRTYRVKMERYSKFSWAERSIPIPDEDLKDPFRGACRRRQLAFANTGERSWYPFGSELMALNLMKPSTGPVRPCQFYSRSPGHAQIASDIQHIGHCEPEVEEEHDKIEYPYWQEFEIARADAGEYKKVWENLKLVTRNDGRPEAPGLTIAVDFFKLSDQNFFEGTVVNTRALIMTLSLYEFACEALYVRERERGSEGLLQKRIPSALTSPPNALIGFIRKIYWVRSKAVHGVIPLRDLVKLITSEADKGVPGTDIPDGNYRNLFLREGCFPGFISNTRELVRRSIRFFLEKHNDGLTKDEILEELDGKTV